MTHDMKRNIQMRNMVFTERKQHSRDAGTADLRGGNSILSSRHLRSLLLLFLMMTVGVMGVWGQDDEKPADLKVGGCSETWLRVIETEALPSITGAKVDILFETAK